MYIVSNYFISPKKVNRYNQIPITLSFAALVLDRALFKIESKALISSLKIEGRYYISL